VSEVQHEPEGMSFDEKDQTLDLTHFTPERQELLQRTKVQENQIELLKTQVRDYQEKEMRLINLVRVTHEKVRQLQTEKLREDVKSSSSSSGKSGKRRKKRVVDGVSYLSSSFNDNPRSKGTAPNNNEYMQDVNKEANYGSIQSMVQKPALLGAEIKSENEEKVMTPEHQAQTAIFEGGLPPYHSADRRASKKKQSEAQMQEQMDSFAFIEHMEEEMKKDEKK